MSTSTKRASRPDHMFMGNHTYEICWLTEDEWQNNHLDINADACTYVSRQTIFVRLREGSHESHYQELIIHECLHTIWDATGLTNVNLSDVEDAEEFSIGLITPLTLFLLKMNPSLTAWILSDGAEVR